MELTQIGKFIAELRKEQGFTQEQLGDKIGVTNKTISRWETGMYLPPADALLMISELFDVSINEILCGKRLSKEEYKEAAEENLKQTIKASSFSLKVTKPLLVSGSMILLILGHAWRNNAMMTYVEQNAFDGSGRQ